MSFDLISLDTIQALATEYGYWSIFIGVMLENMGIPLPGETIILVGGFLAGNDELDYGWVLGCTIGGAVLGDNFGYWLGYWGGWSFLQGVGRLFRIPEERLLKVREQFSQNAAKAVFLGRFVTLLRVFAGPLAGMVRMPYLLFLGCNLAGASLWAAVMVTLSYFAGRMVTLETLVAGVAKFSGVALILVVATIAVPLWLESRRLPSDIPKP